MSQAVITKAFVEWKANQAIDNQPIVLDEFFFANVPGLDVSKPIDNTEGMPSADHIVHRQAVSKAGVVNAGSVVYSVTMGADVGDFSFNWIGLANKATGVLAMIIHAPTQQKIKNDNGQQGNVLVRSMLMEFSGAQAATNITTPAETWQIDFTARLAGMDEAERLANQDIYGSAAFFDAGFLVAKAGQQFYVTQGVGYVGGLRAALASNENITVGVKPVKVWVDVCYQGTLTSAYQTVIKFTLADTLQNYVSNGIAHYVFALASIDAAGNITDLRPKGSLNEQAGNSAFVRKDKNLADMSNPQEALNTLGGVPKVRKVNNKALTQDIALTPSDVGALPYDATAVAASKLATAHKIAGVDFDGSADISINAGNVGAVEQGGGVGMRNNNVVHIGWSDGNKILAQIDNTPFGALYCESNKPTPADVGALAVTGGDVEYINGARHYASKSGSWEGAGGFAAQYENGSAPFMVPFGYMAPKEFSQYHPIVKGILQTKDYGYAGAFSFGAVTSGNGDFPVAIINVTTDSRASQAWSFNPNDGAFYSPGDINSGRNISSAGNISVGGGISVVGGVNSVNDIYTERNIHNNGIIQAGSGIYDTPGVRAYSPNYRPPPSEIGAVAADTCSYAGFAAGNPQSPYMRNSSNGEVVALARYDWVNSRIDDVVRWAGTDLRSDIYSWVKANFVADVKIGPRVTFWSSVPGWTDAWDNLIPPGAVNISSQTYNDNRVNRVVYAYVMKLINDNWYNVGG